MQRYANDRHSTSVHAGPVRRLLTLRATRGKNTAELPLSQKASPNFLPSGTRVASRLLPFCAGLGLNPETEADLEPFKRHSLLFIMAPAQVGEPDVDGAFCNTV